ncbi:MAG: hypothetical protein RL562_3086 [Planctomycetota bacterium]
MDVLATALLRAVSSQPVDEDIAAGRTDAALEDFLGLVPDRSQPLCAAPLVLLPQLDEGLMQQVVRCDGPCIAAPEQDAFGDLPELAENLLRMPESLRAVVVDPCSATPPPTRRWK